MPSERWAKAIPRRCARSPTFGLSRARWAPGTRTGSLSPPKLRISRYLPRLLLPLAAIVPAIPLLLWWCSVDEQKLRLRPVSFAAVEGWAADDHAAALQTLVKSCRKKPTVKGACKQGLSLWGKTLGGAGER